MTEPPALNPEPAEQESFYQDLVDEMIQHLETVRDLPGLDKFQESHELPRAFFDHFNTFLAIYDKLIDAVLEFSDDDRKIHCKKGCANCCIDLVRGMTTPEIINIYNHVRPWPDAKQLFEYNRDSAERFSYILMNKAKPGEAPPDGQDPRVVGAHMEYNLLQRPCGFLDQETGCCRIYPVRPVACRYFFSLDRPEFCTPAHEKYFNRETRTVHLPERIHALLREIDHAFGFRPLNYLAGAFCHFTAQTMQIQMIRIVD